MLPGICGTCYTDAYGSLPLFINLLQPEEDSDDDSDQEETRAKMWFLEMKKAADQSPTAKQILLIRKDLCQKVQKELDELKTYTSIDYCMNTSPIFQELYCHLLQLEHFLFHL